MFSRKSLISLAAMIIAIPMLVSAQQPAPTSPEDSTRQERRERLRERHKERGERHKRLREHGMRHMMRGLELSDAQREQMKAISQRHMESTKLQREELLQLRDK